MQDMRLTSHGRFRRAVKLSLLASVIGPAALAAGYAHAQDQSGKGNSSTELKAVQVTGSRIRRIDAEGPTPVETITSQSITNAGYSTVQEVFDNLSLNVGGTLAQNQTFGFTPGASGVDLRGLGVGRTLVLVDGRRPPVYPISAGGTSNFFDLASIPTAIVDRIEILTTGGSAIYGSDAITGVINIITKRHVTGLAGSLRAGGTEHGGYSNQRYQLTYGFSNDKDDLVVSGEIFHNDPLHSSQRGYASSDKAPGTGLKAANYSLYGATFVDFNNSVLTPSPTCQTLLGGGGRPNITSGGFPGFAGTFCAFDRATQRDLYPSIDRTSLYSHFDHDFGFATFYAQALYTNQETESRLESFPYASQLINAANSPSGQPGYFYRRVVEFGQRGASTNDITTAFLTGLKGNFRGYDWDVGLARNQVTSNDTFPSIIKSALDNAVCGGGVSNGACTYVNGPGLNLLDPIPQSVVQSSSYLRDYHAISQNTTIDATVNGPLGFKLPGGDAQFAAFTSFERDYYSDINDPITASGQGVDGAVSARGNSGHLALATEIDLPVLKQVSLNVAGRYDHYNNLPAVKGQFTEQGSLQYRPIEQVLLRGSIGTTFRAPDLQRTFGGTTTGFESAFDTPKCSAQGGTIGDGIAAHTACNNQVQSIPVSSSGNTQLKAEKGTNYSFGFVVEPVDKLSLSMDYYYVLLRNAVTSPTAQFILNQCAEANALCNLIGRDNQGNLVGAGARIVEDPLNSAFLKQKGVDTKVNYSFTYAPVGKFDLGYTMTYLFSFTEQLNGQSPVVQNLVTSVIGSVPRFRWTTTLGWTLGPVGANATWNYVPKFAGTNSANPALQRQYIPTFTQVNLQAHYKLPMKWGTFRLGVNNILNAHPPYDPTDTNNQFTSGSALAYSNSFGREGFAQYEFKF